MKKLYILTILLVTALTSFSSAIAQRAQLPNPFPENLRMTLTPPPLEPIEEEDETEEE